MTPCQDSVCHGPVSVQHKTVLYWTGLIHRAGFWQRRFPWLILHCAIRELLPSVLWHCWLGGRKGIRPLKNMGGWWRWAMVSLDGVAPSRMVSVSASANLPLHHKVQKFSSGTSSPGWSRKKGHKMVVVWWCYKRISAPPKIQVTSFQTLSQTPTILLFYHSTFTVASARCIVSVFPNFTFTFHTSWYWTIHEQQAC